MTISIVIGQNDLLLPAHVSDAAFSAALGASHQCVDMAWCTAAADGYGHDALATKLGPKIAKTLALAIQAPVSVNSRPLLVLPDVEHDDVEGLAASLAVLSKASGDMRFQLHALIEEGDDPAGLRALASALVAACADHVQIDGTLNEVTIAPTDALSWEFCGNRLTGRIADALAARLLAEGYMLDDADLGDVAAEAVMHARTRGLLPGPSAFDGFVDAVYRHFIWDLSGRAPRRR